MKDRVLRTAFRIVDRGTRVRSCGPRVCATWCGDRAVRPELEWGQIRAGNERGGDWVPIQLWDGSSGRRDRGAAHAPKSYRGIGEGSAGARDRLVSALRVAGPRRTFEQRRARRRVEAGSEAALDLLRAQLPGAGECQAEAAPQCRAVGLGELLREHARRARLRGAVGEALAEADEEVGRAGTRVAPFVEQRRLARDR